jgi:hypothetical protein
MAVRKKRVVRRVRKHARRVPMHGAGFWGDVWDGIKSGVNTINDIAKKTKVASTLAPLIPTYGGVASTVLKQAGYGRRKRRSIILA